MKKNAGPRLCLYTVYGNCEGTVYPTGDGNFGECDLCYGQRDYKHSFINKGIKTKTAVGIKYVGKKRTIIKAYLCKDPKIDFQELYFDFF